MVGARQSTVAWRPKATSAAWSGRRYPGLKAMVCRLKDRARQAMSVSTLYEVQAGGPCRPGMVYMGGV